MAVDPEQKEGALWRFALQFYALPGVSEACLALQDRAGVDVIQLITLVYGDWIGRPLGPDHLRDLREHTAQWREQTVLPLRQLRRFLKAPLPGFDTDKDTLRKTIKSAELGAERLQLAMSEAWLLEGEERNGLPLSEAMEELIRLYSSDGQLEQAARDAATTIISARVAMRLQTNNPVKQPGVPRGDQE